MIWLYITIGILGLALLFVAAVTLACYFNAFYQRKKPQNHYRLPKGKHFETNKEEMCSLIGEMEKVPYERVYTKSYDGLRLSARYYHVADGAPLQIQAHGYRGTGVRDFCGGNKLARKSGFNTLLIDMRAHGESQGHTITFGIRERKDILSWIDYATKRFGNTPIFLVGVSMGAATVLMASELNLPDSVKGIIADSPYDSPLDIIADTCRERNLNPKFMTPFIKLAACVFGRFRLGSADATTAVAHTKIPILLIHGEEDTIVPCEMSRKIYRNCHGYAELHTFPFAGHGLSYMADNARYERIVSEFIAKAMNSEL